MKISIKDITDITKGMLSGGDPEEFVEQLSIDSRTIKEGEWFVALDGERSSGNDFISEALKKGAAGVITGRKADISCPGFGIVTVDDTREALWKISGYARERSQAVFIAVTGTNGKTTVKRMIGKLVSSEKKVYVSPKSYNNKLGVSLTFCNMPCDADVVVVEIGTNSPGEIFELSSMVRPSVAVITNIGYGHLSGLGSKEGAFREKISMLENISSEGVVFLNIDDDLLPGVEKDGVDIRYFGEGPKADHRIHGIIGRDKGYEFMVNDERYVLPLEGRHNIYNFTASLAVAKNMGISEGGIGRSLSDLDLPGMRLESVNVGGVEFINDSYNSNPSSFVAALDVLALRKVEGKKIVVAGDMMELGSCEKDLHVMTGNTIAQKGIDLLISVGELSRDIASGAIVSGMSKDDVFSAADNDEAVHILTSVVNAGDLVLVKGSRKMRMEEIIECFSTSFTR